MNHVTLSQGQEAWHWHFADGKVLDFSTGTPIVDNVSSMFSVEGCISYSNQSGELQFYSNGGSTSLVNNTGGAVWNKSHVVMQNGEINNVSGCASAVQSGLVIPSYSEENVYYIFNVDCGEFDSLDHKGLNYTRVDMNQNGGDGSIDQNEKGVMIYQNPQNRPGEGLSATRHANGEDYWIVTSALDTWNQHEQMFYVFNYSPDGISGPTTFTFQADTLSLSQLKISASGTKLFHGNYLYDFDHSNGTITNQRKIAGDSYGVAFSPSGRYIYRLDSLGMLAQFDSEVQNVGASGVQLGSVLSAPTGGSMQLGPDGKIYILQPFSQYIAVVNEPESAGTACAYVSNQVDMGAAVIGFGLPNFIDSDLYLNNFVGIGNQTVTEFSVFPNPSDGSLTVTSSLSDAVVAISTLDGKELLQYEYPTGAVEMKLNLPNGMYLVSFFDQSNRLIGKKRVLLQK